MTSRLLIVAALAIAIGFPAGMGPVPAGDIAVCDPGSTNTCWAILSSQGAAELLSSVGLLDCTPNVQFRPHLVDGCVAWPEGHRSAQTLQSQHMRLQV